MTTVVKVSGQLHMAFHILQSIFTVFGPLLQLTQTILQWKKLNQNKVSDCYLQSRELYSITLEEISRLFWDKFMKSKAIDIINLVEQCTDSQILCVKLVNMYWKYIYEKAQNSCDECVRLCYNYVIMAILYRQFHDAMGSICVITQEHIKHTFLGIFILLEKLHYTKVVMSAIERQYGDYDFEVLQEITISSAMRNGDP